MPTSQLHYVVRGSGPDVLLIHGWVSSNQMWSGMMDALENEARFWAVDLPGFGDSPPLGSDLSIVQHAQILAQFCDAHDIRPSAIIGHSMGAAIAAKLGWLRPELAKCLMLVCPIITGQVGPYGIGGHIMRWLPQFKFARDLLKNGEWVWRIAQNPLLLSLFVSPWGTKTTLSRQLTTDFQRTHWIAGVHGLYSMTNEDLRSHLPHVQQPTWVLVAGRDSTVSPNDGRIAAQLLPHSRLIVYPTAQHHLPEEKPRRFHKTVRAFLRNLPK